MFKALITGITGQDGSYLAEFLLSKGYEVHGLIRRASTFNTARIDHLYHDPHDPEARLFLHYGDLVNAEQMTPLIYEVRPDEIYHLGAQSHVRVSFDMPEYTGDVTAWARRVSSRRSGVVASRLNSIRPLAAKCLVRRRRPKMNRPHFNLGVRMLLPKSMPTGWW